MAGLVEQCRERSSALLRAISDREGAMVMLRLLDFVPIRAEELSKYKLHLAIGPKDRKEPLYELANSSFESWQEQQSKRNFKREYILALIYYNNHDEWLFGGIYRQKGVKTIEGNGFQYDTDLLDTGKELIGRLVLSFRRSCRQSYLDLEHWAERITVVELSRTPRTVVPFPGYENVLIDFGLLKSIVGQEDQSWKSALSAVKGVYIITDKHSGKVYVGSAYGQDSFWSRWSLYTVNGHGGNKELLEVINKEGPEYVSNFQFSVLEVRSSITSKEEIEGREAHWKAVLRSREFGYNRN